MDVLDDTGNGLVLVDDAVDAEAPHRGPAERGEQHATHCVTERMTEAALERLNAEFRDVGIVVALRRLDELRPNKSLEIDCLSHCVQSWSFAAQPRRRPAPPLTRGRLVRELGSRRKPKSPACCVLRE
jgi:hypothetical protein